MLWDGGREGERQRHILVNTQLQKLQGRGLGSKSYSDGRDRGNRDGRRAQVDGNREGKRQRGKNVEGRQREPGSGGKEGEGTGDADTQSEGNTDTESDSSTRGTEGFAGESGGDPEDQQWIRRQTRRPTRADREGCTPRWARIRMGKKIHNYDEDRDTYDVMMLTNAATAARWARYTEDKLGTVLMDPHKDIPIYDGSAWWMAEIVDGVAGTVQGRYLGKEIRMAATLGQMSQYLGRLGQQPDTVRGKFTSRELGLEEEAPLTTVVSDYWIGERRRGRDPPIEIECQLPGDLPFQKQARAERRWEQSHLPSSRGEAQQEGEPWLKEHMSGTRRQAPITCKLETRKDTITWCCKVSPAGILQMDKDHVRLTRKKKVLWQMEKAKFLQWKRRTGKDNVELAMDGMREEDRADRTRRREARLPAWPMLKAIAEHMGIGTLSGPGPSV